MYQTNFYKKDYSNPLFRRIKEKKMRRRKWQRRILVLFAILLFLTAISAIVYYFLFNPTFTITEIKITGTHHIEKQQVQDSIRRYFDGKRFYVLPQNNYWLLKTDHLTENIKSKFYIRNVSVQKIKPNTILLRLEEWGATAIIAKGDQQYIINELGVILREIDENQDNLLVIYNIPGRIEVLNAVIATPELSFIMEAKSKLADLNTDIQEVIWDEFGQIILKSPNFDLYLDLNNNLDEQITNFKTILANINQNQEQIEYIDLRFGNKIYYKNSSADS